MANQPDVRIRLSAEGVKEVVQALQQVQAQAKQSAKQASEVGGSFDAATKGIAALKSAVGALAAAAAGLAILDKIKELATLGVEKNSVIEQANVGIAAVLASQAKLADSNGRVLRGQEAYAAAVELSAQYMDGLQAKAAGTGLDVGVLAEQSRQIVFTGLNAGIKDLDQLQELTVAAAKTLRLLGEDADKTGEQVKNILIGDESDILDALGIQSETTKKWLEKGTLVKELTKRINEQQAALEAYSKTWDGLKARAMSALSSILGASTSGLFDKLKQGLAGALSGLYADTGKLRPEVQAVAGFFNDIGTTLGGAIAAGIASMVSGVRSAGVWLNENSKTVNAIATGFSNVVSYIGQALQGLGGIVGAMNLMTRAAGAVSMMFNTIAAYVALTQQGIAKILTLTSTNDAQKVYYENEAALARKRAELNYKNAKDGLNVFLTGQPGGPAATEAGAADGKGKGSGAKVKDRANKKLLTDEEVRKAQALADAKLAVKVAQAEQEAKLAEAQAKLMAAKEKAAYEEGTLALKDYHQKRLAELSAAAEREMVVLKEKLAKAEAMPNGKPEEKVARDKAMDEANSAITLREKQLEIDLYNEEQAQKAELNTLNREATKLTAEYKELMGQRGEVARQALEVEIADQAKLLAQQGASSDKIKEITDAMRKRGQAQINFDTESTNADAINSKYDLQKKGVEIDQAGGRLWGFEAAQKLAEIEKNRLADLEAAAQKMAEIANGPGGTDEMKRKAEELNLAVKQLRDTTNDYGQAMAKLKQTLESSLTSGFNNMLDSLIEGTATAKEAFRAFAYDVISNIRKVAQEFMVQQAMKMFFSGFTGGATSFFSTGGLVKAATGGYITGPGTGTSDSIPARLSNGEYVLRADAVKSLGVDTLNMLNATGSLNPMLANSYAVQSIPTVDGGLANSIQQAAGGGTSRIELGLEPGLVAKHIKSTEGQQAVVEVMATRRRSVKKATG